jgi:hypothetical protein
MIPKSIQGSPSVPKTFGTSDVQNSETLRESLPSEGKTPASPESRTAKLFEGNLQASARAADLNSQLNAQGPQEPNAKGTASFYDLLISSVKEEKKPEDANSIFKDFDKGTMPRNQD